MQNPAGGCNFLPADPDESGTLPILSLSFSSHTFFCIEEITKLDGTILSGISVRPDEICWKTKSAGHPGQPPSATYLKETLASTNTCTCTPARARRTVTQHLPTANREVEQRVRNDSRPLVLYTGEAPDRYSCLGAELPGAAW